jgi:menaquinol-cytochrome c reductase iron-sulfur subunit
MSITSVSLLRKFMTREAFMGLFIASVGGIASVVIGVPILGYALQPLIQQPKDVWRDIGAVDSIPVGQTVQRNFSYPADESAKWAGNTQLTSAWVRRNTATSFTAYAVYCTHLGCPVLWLATPRIFMCPCHGSVFNGDGTVAGGPAPRPLFQYPIRVVNGRIQVKTEAQPLTL